VPNPNAGAADYLGTLLTTSELCKQLKIKPQYLRWLRRRHGLPCVKVGGEVRFLPASVNAWLAARDALRHGHQSSNSPEAPIARSLRRAGTQKRLREEIVKAALYRSTDELDLEAALERFHDPVDRTVLRAVITVALVLNESGGEPNHSVLCDAEGEPEVLAGQVREAHEHRGQVLENVLNRLCEDAANGLESNLTAIADITIGVLAIRELHAGPKAGDVVGNAALDHV
jgi:excisionase family DNA binding protein